MNKKNRFFFTILHLVFLLFTSCTAAQINLNDEAKQIRVSKEDPGPEYTDIGPVSVRHGSGCGAYGSKGNLENAYNLLKNEGHAKGAEYIQILNIIQPHAAGDCFVNSYVIEGMLYKRK